MSPRLLFLLTTLARPTSRSSATRDRIDAQLAATRRRRIEAAS